MPGSETSADESACGAPPRNGGPHASDPGPVQARATEGLAGRFVELDGGVFNMGCDDGPYPDDGEGPVRQVTLSPFAISATAVSNSDFMRFIRATRYVTCAERYRWSFVFAGLLPDDFPATRASVQTPWWRQVHGADWRHPEGPHSDLTDRLDHPVVHVSWTDAVAYCDWAGASLPTEAQWEYAARGGLDRQPFPWGSAVVPEGQHRMNVWQGEFPGVNTGEDGFVGPAPVLAYPPNGFGLYNMTGNVWEWVRDRFSAYYHRKATRVDPTGPKFGSGRVLKGGSYLCHASYCLRYRTSARMPNTPDSSSGNVGFRCSRMSSP